MQRQRLIRACRILWMITAWLGVFVGLLLFLLAALQAIFPEVRILDVERGDLLAALGFFGLMVGLCVWLIIYGRRLFRPLLVAPDRLQVRRETTMTREPTEDYDKGTDPHGNQRGTP